MSGITTVSTDIYFDTAKVLGPLYSNVKVVQLIRITKRMISSSQIKYVLQRRQFKVDNNWLYSTTVLVLLVDYYSYLYGVQY